MADRKTSPTISTPCLPRTKFKIRSSRVYSKIRGLDIARKKKATRRRRPGQLGPANNNFDRGAAQTSGKGAKRRRQRETKAWTVKQQPGSWCGKDRARKRLQTDITIVKMPLKASNSQISDRLASLNYRRRVCESRITYKTTDARELDDCIKRTRKRHH